MPKKYKKKPVVIEAMQYTDENLHKVIQWVNSGLRPAANCKALWNGHALIIRTLEGDMFAGVGDWIIRGVKGEFYPCNPDIFEMTYDEVGESA